jgi:nicotinamidase-related amidase
MRLEHSSKHVEMLNEVLATEAEMYADRDFGRRIGFGEHPALLNIDLGYGWTRPDATFSCENMDEIVAGVEQLLEAARSKGLPIAFTTTAYAVTAGPNTDMGLWHRKLPVETLGFDSRDVEIDERIAPRAGEQIITKKRSSAFHGTYLAGFLRAAGVDTVIITGVAMGGCVRHSVEDALAEGFRPIVVRECVGDHTPGAAAWNLFDVDRRFGDVEGIATVLSYLEQLPSMPKAVSSAPAGVSDPRS